MSSRGKRWVLVLVALVLLGVVLPPFITVGLFKKHIQTSMSQALDRPVIIGNT